MVGDVLTIIAELKQLGMTMILATHQMGFAFQIADRVAFLDAGAIVEEGPAKQVLVSRSTRGRGSSCSKCWRRRQLRPQAPEMNRWWLRLWR